jgi:hypothetical protein
LREKQRGVEGSIDDLIVNSIVKGEGTNDQKALSLVGLGMDVKTADDILRAGGVSPLFGEGVTGPENAARGQADAVVKGTEAFNDIARSSALVSDAFALVGDTAVKLAAAMGSVIPGYKQPEFESNTASSAVVDAAIANQTANNVQSNGGN